MKLAIALWAALTSSVACATVQEDTLIGGTPADPKEWPASVYVSMGNGRCSGTIVGPKTLIFAAHCVDNGGQASFTVNGTVVKGKCAHHPNYRNDQTADWSLCLLDKTILPKPFENVATTQTYTCARQEQVTLAGFGCTKSDRSQGNDGIFRVGASIVSRCPTASFDIVTQGGSVVCPGDSGGAVYKLNGDKRIIIAVNSRTGVDGDRIVGPSYLSSVANPIFYNWASNWAATNNTQICGINAAATGCRDAEAPPPPQPQPPTCMDKLSAVKTALTALDQCLNLKN